MSDERETVYVSDEPDAVDESGEPEAVDAVDPPAVSPDVNVEEDNTLGTIHLGSREVVDPRLGVEDLEELRPGEQRLLIPDIPTLPENLTSNGCKYRHSLQLEFCSDSPRKLRDCRPPRPIFR